MIETGTDHTRIYSWSSDSHLGGEQMAEPPPGAAELVANPTNEHAPADQDNYALVALVAEALDRPTRLTRKHESALATIFSSSSKLAEVAAASEGHPTPDDLLSLAFGRLVPVWIRAGLKDDALVDELARYCEGDEETHRRRNRYRTRKRADAILGLRVTELLGAGLIPLPVAAELSAKASNIAHAAMASGAEGRPAPDGLFRTLQGIVEAEFSAVQRNLDDTSEADLPALQLHMHILVAAADILDGSLYRVAAHLDLARSLTERVSAPREASVAVESVRTTFSELKDFLVHRILGEDFATGEPYARLVATYHARTRSQPDGEAIAQEATARAISAIRDGNLRYTSSRSLQGLVFSIAKSVWGDEVRGASKERAASVPRSRPDAEADVLNLADLAPGSEDPLLKVTYDAAIAERDAAIAEGMATINNVRGALRKAQRQALEAELAQTAGADDGPATSGGRRVRKNRMVQDLRALIVGSFDSARLSTVLREHPLSDEDAGTFDAMADHTGNGPRVAKEVAVRLGVSETEARRRLRKLHLQLTRRLLPVFQDVERPGEPGPQYDVPEREQELWQDAELIVRLPDGTRRTYESGQSYIDAQKAARGGQGPDSRLSEETDGQ